MGGALDGIRVLELARYQAGPRGGMILSDLGAEVIKIENWAARRRANRNRWCAAKASISRSTTAARRACASTCAPSAARRSLPPCADRRHRPAEFPARRHGKDGLRLRPAAPAEARHHPVFGVRVRAVRPVSRASGLRPAGAGDERADEPDRQAGRPAAGRRDVAGGPVHLAACDDRHAGGAAPPRPHRRGAGRRLLPVGFRLHDGGNPAVVLSGDRQGRRRGRAAALQMQGRVCRDLGLGPGDGDAADPDRHRRRERHRRRAGRAAPGSTTRARWRCRNGARKIPSITSSRHC